MGARGKAEKGLGRPLASARDLARKHIRMVGSSGWEAIVARAAEIVNMSNTGMTLRQTFYRLVSEQRIANTRSEYKMLSTLHRRRS